MAAAAREYGVAIVGGNVASGPALTVTTTVVGAPGERTVLRSGARAGDAICLTGPVGGAALALALLREGRPVPPDLLERYRRPRPRLDAAETIARVATAAIDVSDGLVQDLSHLAAASGVGARIGLDRIPLPGGYAALGGSLGGDLWRFALAGGDDYEVIFTAPQDARHPYVAIGEAAEPAAGVVVLERDGTPHPAPAGFAHLR